MSEEYPFHPYRQEWRRNLRLHINIDVTTRDRAPEYMQGIISSIETNKPFVIYCDQKDFLVALPQFRIVICFAGGILQTKEISGTHEQFIDRLKMAMTVYDKYATVDEWYKTFPAIKNVYLLSK